MLLSFTRCCHTLALLAFALLLPTIRAVPLSKNAHTSILASSSGPQKARHDAHMVGAPGRLGARGPGDRVAHPASLLHTMKMVPGTFKNLGAIVPVQQAAAAMESFFQQLIFNVQNRWSSQPRHHNIQYDNHGFRLTITAMGDTIPWEFVQHTAFNGLELAARGFTELFDIMYANADGNILVAVSLRLLDHTLPSGSGESSQTGGADPGRDWREGSVPSVGTGADAANNVNNNNMLGAMNWGGGTR